MYQCVCIVWSGPKRNRKNCFVIVRLPVNGRRCVCDLNVCILFVGGGSGNLDKPFNDNVGSPKKIRSKNIRPSAPQVGTPNFLTMIYARPTLNYVRRSRVSADRSRRCFLLSGKKVSAELFLKSLKASICIFGGNVGVVFCYPGNGAM